MCSHEPATPHFNQDYKESSGFQNCIWGLGYYLLNPNPVVQYFACRLKERTALVNLSMKCICQLRSAAPGLPLRKSYSHLTHDVNLLRENQYCPDWSRWWCEVFLCLGRGLEDIWLFPLMHDFFFILSNQQQTSSREKPPARIAASSWGQRSGSFLPVREDCVHLQAHFKQQLRFQPFILSGFCCFWLLPLPS